MARYIASTVFCRQSAAQGDAPGARRPDEALETTTGTANHSARRLTAPNGASVAGTETSDARSGQLAVRVMGHSLTKGNSTRLTPLTSERR